jgi:hypothetical protein
MLEKKIRRIWVGGLLNVGLYSLFTENLRRRHLFWLTFIFGVIFEFTKNSLKKDLHVIADQSDWLFTIYRIVYRRINSICLNLRCENHLDNQEYLGSKRPEKYAKSVFRP